MAHLPFIRDGLLVLGDGTWFLETRLVVVAGLVLAAAIIDLRQRRIPNRLVAFGLAVALLWHLAFPYELGLLSGLAGLATGIGLLLPFFLLRGMAAGDVKLMGMVGAFIGPWAVMWVVLLTFLLGGGWAVAWLTAKGAWSRLGANLWVMWHSLIFGQGPALQGTNGVGAGLKSVGVLPYGVAIAAGTLLLIGLVKQGVVVV